MLWRGREETRWGEKRRRGEQGRLLPCWFALRDGRRTEALAVTCAIGRRESERPLHSLVKFVLGLREGIRVGDGSDRIVLPGRRPARRGDRRRACRLAEGHEDRRHRGRLGDEGDDLHLGATVGAGQRNNLEQAGDEHGPQVARRGARRPILVIARCICARVGLRRGAARFPGQGGDLRAQRRVGREHAMVAVAMYARGRNQEKGTLPFFLEREGKGDATLFLGLEIYQRVGNTGDGC